MTMPDTMSHDQAIELLPWLVNNSLDDNERDVVREHANSCVICRRELAELTVLQAAIVAPTATAGVPEPDMRRINARIDALIQRENRGRALLSRLREVFNDPWRAAFALQSVLLVAIIGVLLQQQPEPQFRTMTTPQTLGEGHFLRVVIDPALDTATITELLAARQLTVIDGPSDRGVYTLRFADSASSARRSSITAELVADPRVLFAELIAGSDAS